MCHPTVSDKRLEFNGNKLRAIIRYDTGFGLRKFLSPPLNNDLHIGFCHLFSYLKMHDVAAISIQNGTQIRERTTDIDIRDIDVPVLVWTCRLVKTFPLFGWRSCARSEKTSTFKHPIHTACETATTSSSNIIKLNRRYPTS